MGHGEEGRRSLIKPGRSAGDSRLVGPSSIIGKTVSDSRRAFLLAVGFLAFVLLTGAAAIASAFGTVVGSWDPMGVVASVALAVGGLAVGAWGLSRRDVRG